MNKVLGSVVRGLVRLWRPGGRGADPRDVWKNASSCAVICGAGIGDSLMAMPLIRAVRSRRPKIRIVVVANAATSSVFAGNPLVDEIVNYGVGAWATFRRLLRLRVDIVLAGLPSNTVRHSLFAAAIEAPVKMKHSYDYGSRTDRDYSFLYSDILPLDRTRHRVEANLDMLRHLGEPIRERSIPMEFRIPERAVQRIEEWISTSGRLPRSGTIAMHPGGGGIYKLWPSDRFARVADALADAGYDVCLVGGAGEGERCAGIVAAVNRASVYSVAGDVALAETAELLRRCRILVGNDTGIMHLAVAVGLPVVALFGPTDPRHIGPFTDRSRVVRCGDEMSSIPVDDVVAAAMDLLAEEARGSASGDRRNSSSRPGTNQSST